MSRTTKHLPELLICSLHFCDLPYLNIVVAHTCASGPTTMVAVRNFFFEIASKTWSKQRDDYVEPIPVKYSGRLPVRFVLPCPSLLHHLYRVGSVQSSDLLYSVSSHSMNGHDSLSQHRLVNESQVLLPLLQENLQTYHLVTLSQPEDRGK